MAKGGTGRKHPTPPNGAGGVLHSAGMMTPRDAAAYLGVEASTLKARRSKGTGPKYYRYSSRCIRYKRADLDDWIEAQAAEEVDNEQG